MTIWTARLNAYPDGSDIVWPHPSVLDPHFIFRSFIIFRISAPNHAGSEILSPDFGFSGAPVHCISLISAGMFLGRGGSGETLIWGRGGYRGCRKQTKLSKVSASWTHLWNYQGHLLTNTNLAKFIEIHRWKIKCSNKYNPESNVPPVSPPDANGP